MKTVLFTSAAARRFDTPEARAAAGGGVKKLQGRDGFRMRAGGWRVLFNEDAATLLVVEVGPRSVRKRFPEGMLMAQRIVTPSGDEMVVLSRAEYERLSALAALAEEEAADVAAYDAAMADLAAGRDEALPAEVSALLLQGLSLVTALRKWRGLTQTQLAERAGLSQGYLSDLESGRRKGGKETLEAVAKALETPVGWLTG